MDSAKGERSISSGISLPQWMKSKIHERYDLEQSAFSPPTEDDGFFFMRYPAKAENVFVNPPERNTNTINEVRRKVSETKPINEADLNLIRHTDMNCRQFMSQANIDPPIQVIKAGPKNVIKSAGVDDEFKTAACGKSVVDVAHQMIGLKLYNGRNSEEFCSNNNNKSSFFRQRRNSKSLPASPMTSPKASPKLAKKNPYFTDSAFNPTDTSLDVNDKNSVTKASGWLFSSLRNQRESTEDLNGASKKTNDRGSTTSIAEYCESFSGPANQGNTSPKILRAKPSELREMNFWSPTSM